MKYLMLIIIRSHMTAQAKSATVTFEEYTDRTDENKGFVNTRRTEFVITPSIVEKLSTCSQTASCKEKRRLEGFSQSGCE